MWRRVTIVICASVAKRQSPYLHQKEDVSVDESHRGLELLHNDAGNRFGLLHLDRSIPLIMNAIPKIIATLMEWQLFLNWFDNNDTVSNSFIWFHSKNETIKREVKLSFGIETTLISLSNWNLPYALCHFIQ